MTKLIVGLGNPGRAYTNTRHNVGFMAVDRLAERWGLRFGRQRGRAEVAEGDVSGQRIILAKPQTFMNNSGDSVRALLKLSNLTAADLLVIADDLDLPFGRLRLRDSGSSGGQRGIQSIINQLATNQFARLRIGIGRPPLGVDPVDYVLTPFTASERNPLPEILDRLTAGVEAYLSEGVARAMNLVNVVVSPTTLP
ncbi:MAG TPA: aminoacyl-tRNA hydrolase [Chloroflexota bacterium]|nr:aminoacyl-tRNA hydrolase [Chloroflexota bacterium]